MGQNFFKNHCSGQFNEARTFLFGWLFTKAHLWCCLLCLWEMQQGSYKDSWNSHLYILPTSFNLLLSCHALKIMLVGLEHAQNKWLLYLASLWTLITYKSCLLLLVVLCYKHHCLKIQYMRFVMRMKLQISPSPLPTPSSKKSLSC